MFHIFRISPKLLLYKSNVKWINLLGKYFIKSANYIMLSTLVPKLFSDNYKFKYCKLCSYLIASSKSFIFPKLPPKLFIYKSNINFFKLGVHFKVSPKIVIFYKLSPNLMF